MAPKAPTALREQLCPDVEPQNEATPNGILRDEHFFTFPRRPKPYTVQSATWLHDSLDEPPAQGDDFDPGWRARRGPTALHAAVEREIRSTVGHLIRPAHRYPFWKEYFCRRDDAGRTALHIACRSGSEALVKLLLRSISKLSEESRQQCLLLKDHEGCTALHSACSSGLKDSPPDCDVVKLLLESFPDKDKHKILLEVNEQGCTALHLACKSPSLPIVEVLLANISNEMKEEFVNCKADAPKKGVLQSFSPTTRKNSALASIGQFLNPAEGDKDVFLDRCSAIFYACFHSHLDIMKLLVPLNRGFLERRIFENKHLLGTFLHQAVGNKNSECAGWLLKNMTEKAINDKDSSNCTAWEKALLPDNFDFDVIKVFVRNKPGSSILLNSSQASRKFYESDVGNALCFAIDQNTLSELATITVLLCDQKKISDTAARCLFKEIGHLPRIGIGYRARSASCSFERPTERASGPEDGARQENDAPDEDEHLPAYTSIAMPYLAFETHKVLDMWRDPDCRRGRNSELDNPKRDLSFPSLTLDEFCYQSLPKKAIERRNNDQATMSVRLNEPSLPTTGKATPQSSSEKGTLIVVKQAWIWQMKDVLLISGCRSDSELRGPRANRSKSKSRRIGMLLTDLSLAPQGPEHMRRADELFLKFEQAILNVSADVEKYVRDVSINAINIDIERKCLHVIIDIQDELSMVKRVILQQEKIWKTFAKKAWPMYWVAGQEEIMAIPNDEHKKSFEEWEFIAGAQTTFKEYYQRIEQLDEDAQRVERSITLMLDLKSKHANLQIANSSAMMSAVVVGFTVVTIIFTPMSYMASLFAVPITSLQRHQDPSFFSNETGVYHPIYVAKATCSAVIATICFACFGMWLSLECLGIRIIQTILKFVSDLCSRVLATPQCPGAAHALSFDVFKKRRKSKDDADEEKGHHTH